MVNAKIIKQILSRIPAGTKLAVSEIQDLVKDNCSLNSDDWKPYTKTRQTKYPRWCHRIQSVLAEYKEKKIVAHEPTTCSYTF